jgi:hypothetical protein
MSAGERARVVSAAAGPSASRRPYNVHDNTWNRVYTTDPSGRLQVRVPQGTYWIAFADGDTGLMTNRAQRRFTITSRGANIGRVWPKDLRPYRAYESG